MAKRRVTSKKKTTKKKTAKKVAAKRAPRATANSVVGLLAKTSGIINLNDVLRAVLTLEAKVDALLALTQKLLGGAVATGTAALEAANPGLSHANDIPTPPTQGDLFELTPATPANGGTEVTKDDVLVALQGLGETSGLPAVSTLLSQFKVVKVSDLKVIDYVAVLAAAKGPGHLPAAAVDPFAL